MIISLLFVLNKSLDSHVMVLAELRALSGNGVVSAVQTTVHTGPWGQSAAPLYICGIPRVSDHRQMRHRLQH